MSSIQRVKEEKRAIIRRYAQANNRKAMAQVLTALIALILLWWATMLSLSVSAALAVPLVLLIALFNLQIFVLMHDCGHGSLFQTRWLNCAFGFVLGVVSGMPQYVWSRNHSYHHSTNGDWDKYRGLYTTLSVEEYAAMTDKQRLLYRLKCSIATAPLAGLIYVIFNPRLTWLRGSIGLVGHIVKGKLARPDLSVKAHSANFETRYWRSPKEYRHIFWNNVLLLSLWLVGSWAFGPLRFFAVYLISGALAGAAGILLFTVQHNFKHSYASDTEHWDAAAAVIEGTSLLIFPRWLNWFTANIAYHHIHHLSSRIPNYHLAKCHNEYQHLFSDVTRVKIAQIPSTLKYILWDKAARQIISVAEYHQQVSRALPPIERSQEHGVEPGFGGCQP